VDGTDLAALDNAYAVSSVESDLNFDNSFSPEDIELFAKYFGLKK